MIKILNENFTEEIVKAIGKFTILWCNFEKEYCDTRCSPNKIKSFAQTHIVNKKYLKNLSEKVKGRVDLLGGCIPIYISYNLVPEGANRPNEEDMEIIRNFVDFEGNDLLCGALL